MIYKQWKKSLSFRGNIEQKHVFAFSKIPVKVSKYLFILVTIKYGHIGTMFCST